MIRGNILGFLFLAIGILAGWLTLAIVGNIGVGYMVGGSVLYGLDLSYRNSRGGRFHPFQGGNLFFIPVWLIGIAVAGYGLIMVITVLMGNSPSRVENHVPATSVVYAPAVAPAPTREVYEPVVAPTSLPIATPTVDCRGPSSLYGLGQIIACGASPTLAPRCVSWKDAAMYVGQTICVTGVVYSAYADPPRQEHKSINFSFIVGFDPAASFYLKSCYSCTYNYTFSEDELRAWEDANLVGKCIKVVGHIEINSYTGQSFMMVESPNQLEMCQK